MADFLTAVKSVRTQNRDEPPDEVLTAVKSKHTKSKDEILYAGHSEETSQTDAKNKGFSVSSPDEILQILRAQPDSDQLVGILSRLNSVTNLYTASGGAFDLHAPGPLQAQIIHTLLNNILPDFWPVLENQHRSDLVACFRNVAGFNAVVTRLKLLSSQGDIKDGQAIQTIKDLIDLTKRLFAGNGVVLAVWLQLEKVAEDKVKREISWKEFVHLVCSGKVVASVAQAEDAVQSRKDSCWLAKASEYATWLGENIAVMAISGADSEVTQAGAAQMFAKALNLGYPEQLLSALFARLVQQDVETTDIETSAVADFLSQTPMHVKRSLTEHSLRWLSSSSAGDDGVEAAQRSQDVSGIAAFVSVLIRDELIRQHILSFLTNPALLISASLTVQRACIAALSYKNCDDDIQTVLDRTMSSFSNTLFINHTPISQQESLAQLLLIAAGYMHRETPMALLMTARSSNHMQGVSNRLDSSNHRARWLGMVIGTAISGLVDKEGSKMHFGTDEMQSEEALSYIELVHVADKVGRLQDFRLVLEAHSNPSRIIKRSNRQARVQELPRLNGKPVFGPPRPPAQTEIVGERVTEILDEDSEDSDDLKPYAKPDSDQEDSDEDATLVNRHKAKPPVYIRDLMSMLRDDSNHDRFQIAVKHAAQLIRRKTGFGSEVEDHAEELAIIFCNLQDPFETENFEELKLQALISIFLADVKTLAPWFCRQAFSGDYSIAQRCIILSSIGLGGRELAGFKNEDELNPIIENADFPSKRLPPRLASTYRNPTSSTKRLEAASKEMEHGLIKPLALQAADQSTAQFNAVKVRTFSSRMEVERTKRKPAPNQLAKIFGEAFFYPLANRYQQEIASYGSASVFASVPFVLVTFVKTLALLLHASGPSTLGLLQISGDFWDLLLSLRVKAIEDVTVLQAVLFALLTLLEVNEDKRRIAEECPKQLMETQRWADLVFERTGGGGLINEDGTQDEVKVRTLAAGVLVKTKEIIDLYQKQLIGYDFEP